MAKRRRLFQLLLVDEAKGRWEVEWGGGPEEERKQKRQEFADPPFFQVKFQHSPIEDKFNKIVV